MQQIQSKIVKRIGILFFWLAVWQLGAWLMGSSVLLPGPWETAGAWWRSIKEAVFWQTICVSCLRIGGGFLLGFLAGSGLACLSVRFGMVRELLAPLMTLLKSVPVAAFTVLLLIWWGSGGLSVAVVFMVVMPSVYVSVKEGLLAADEKMLEMARVFRVPLRNRFFYIYRPALGPFLDSCLGIILGMSWKSGVAAEVIGTPRFSIGERMYLSKVYMDMAELFAWTGTVIVLSFLFERAGRYLWRRFCQWKPVCSAPRKEPGRGSGLAAAEARGDTAHWAGSRGTETPAISLRGISKSFGGRSVLENIDKELEPGKIYCLRAPSGTGKTTLLRILAGLDGPDRDGPMVGRTVPAAAPVPVVEAAQDYTCSMVFQEDRLLEEESAVTNVMLAVGGKRREEIWDHLSQILPPEAIRKPCRQLSGGMRRRVCLVRAMMAPGKLVLLDEAFVGLDRDTRERAAKYVLEHREGRTLVAVTHDEADVALLGGESWQLNCRQMQKTVL